MELKTIQRNGNGVYHLYCTEVPDEMTDYFSTSFIEFLEYCDLDTTLKMLPILLEDTDRYHMCLINRVGHDQYTVMVVGGAENILEYVLKTKPICVGTLEIVAEHLREFPVPAIEPEDPDMDLEF